jgi:hypothetical protein
VTTTAVAPSPPATTSPPEVAGPNRLLTLLRRPVVACLVLLCAYAGLSLALNDPRGTLGTDTGGKLATLRVMDQRGTLDPDIGYWAESSDPKGALHPLYYTYRVGDGWVNVTTLPMLYAAYPLYLVGGDRAILLLPMLGALLAALAARSLARRLGARTGWPAFWVIGLASPLAIYALDFWEHALGLGLMLWGVDWFLRAAGERGRVRDWVIGGALFGAAATMRTEALVYLAVCGGIACLLWLVRERNLLAVIGRGLAVLAGAGVMLAANEVLERLVLGTSLRGARASGTAAAAGTSLGDRAHEAGTYVLGTNRLAWAPDLVLGGAIVLLVVTGTWLLLRTPQRSLVPGVAALVAAGLLYLFVMGHGLGFVPGLLIASPFAAVGLVLGWRRDVRVITAMAVAALPLVWFFQYSGGAGPQWGARYMLLSGALLLVAATVVLDGRRAAFVGVLLVALLVTGFGIAWLSVRSTWVASGMEAIVARHDQAIISGSQHLLREGGAFYEPDAHWLTASQGAQLHRAVDIIDAAGDREFAYVVGHGAKVPDEIGPFRKGSTEQVQFLRSDVTVDVVTYRAP